MIVVTGTMRSGTSMWMQAMQAGGLQTVGAAFPEPWGERLREANPRGFYESKLLSGIYFGTNPDPATGAYLHPARSRRLVAKVFVPGLIRTDIAFLDRVLATVRPWREYAASIARMKAMDGDGLAARLGSDTARARATAVSERASPRQLRIHSSGGPRGGSAAGSAGGASGR